MLINARDRERMIAAEEKRLAAETRAGMHKVHDGGRGLYLAIGGAEAKSWVYRFKLDKTTYDMGLGSAAALSLQDAVEEVDKQRALHAKKINPLIKRRQEREQVRLEKAKLITFRQCAELYITENRSSWKNDKHIAQWYMTVLGRTPDGRATQEDYCKSLHDLPVQDITVTHVRDVLRPIWLDKHETAARIRNRIEMILNYATPQHRVGDNPALWATLKSKLPKLGRARKAKHHRALPHKELPGFMEELRGRPGISCRALEFLILTCARTNECINATWEQVDFIDSTWSLADEDMKAGTSHKVPLSPRAIAILREMQNRAQSKYIFPGQRVGQPLSDAALAKVVKLLGRAAKAVPHGFRSTFKDWAFEKARDRDGHRFDRAVAEMCLAHKVGGAVEQAYLRSDGRDLRTELLQVWDAYCMTPSK